MTIDRLLLVAGPSCSGKSTLIQRLYAGELPEVAARLRLGDVSAWRCVLPNDLPAVVETGESRVLLHYDFLRPWTGGKMPDYGAEEPLRLAGTAAEVTLLTLWVPPEELHRRMAERRSAFVRALLRGRPWDSESLRTSRRASPLRSGPPPDRRRSLRKTWAIVRELRRLGEKVRSFRRGSEVEALYDAWLSFWSESPAEHWVLDGAMVPASEWQFRRS